MAWRGLAKLPGYGADVPSAHPSSAQARVDRIAAEARRAALPAVAPPPPPIAPLAPSDDALERRLAEEIAYARRLLDSMAEKLSADTGVLTRHTRTLQGFDIVGQMLDGLGSVIAAKNKADAIDRLGMEDLRNRLKRKGLNDGAKVPRTGAELEWGADWICQLGRDGC